MLPPGTLQALKGHYDGIVVVVLFAVAVAGLLAGAAPWALILLFAYRISHVPCPMPR
jgi:hypothetical protein